MTPAGSQWWRIWWMEHHHETNPLMIFSLGTIQFSIQFHRGTALTGECNMERTRDEKEHWGCYSRCTWEGDRKKLCSRQAEKTIVIGVQTEWYRNTLFWISAKGVRSICASVFLASYLWAGKPRTGQQDRGKSSKPLVIFSFSNFVRGYVQWYGGFRANRHWHLQTSFGIIMFKCMIILLLSGPKRSKCTKKPCRN